MREDKKTILEVNKISKTFPGVQALREVSVGLRAGEIVGLVGENGAGKSTLVKVLAGIYHPDGGEILVDGVEVQLNNPWEAEKQGLAFVHQQLNLVPSFDIVDNAFLGKWIRGRGGIVNKLAMKKQLQEICQQFGFNLELSTLAKELTTSEQWMVQIVRAFLEKPKILVMDEPTAALSDQEVKSLFETVKKIAAQGVAIIYVSHRLNEIFTLCDRIVVLRNGEKVWEGSTDEISQPELIAKMVGEGRVKSFFVTAEAGKDKILEVQSLSDGSKIKELTFEVYEREVFGIYGLQGSGRTELVEMLFGLRTKEKGEVRLKGKTFSPTSPEEAIAEGVALVPEDRAREGLVTKHSVIDNIALPHLSRYAGLLGYFKGGELRSVASGVLDKLRVNYRGLRELVQFLSGGNQQKVVLAKWLIGDFSLLLLDEPTVGVDVGARRELYELMHKLASEGWAVVVISSDLEEMIEINPHRVMVMKEGRMTGILSPEKISRENILNLCY